MATEALPRDPWERRRRETAKAYAAFEVYYRMPTAERSYRAVARDLGKSGSLISKWMGQHEWRERAEAWDAEQSRIARAQLQERIQKMRADHATTGAALISMGLRTLQARWVTWQETLKGEIAAAVPIAQRTPPPFTPREAARLVAVGGPLESRALGEPDRLVVKPSSEDEPFEDPYAHVPLDERRALLERLRAVREGQEEDDADE